MGVLPKEDSDWRMDTVPKGAFTLRKLGKDDFDIIFIDSTKRNYSTAQDGAKVFPLRRNETAVQPDFRFLSAKVVRQYIKVA